MSLLTLLGYIADAAILGTYAVLSHTGKPRAFHWANALGGVPLVIAEVYVQLWQVLVLTGTFTLLGWYGLWTTRRRTSS